MNGIWSRKYRAWELAAVGVSVGLVLVGLYEGRDFLSHAGAVITFLGVMLTFAAAEERRGTDLAGLRASVSTAAATVASQARREYSDEATVAPLPPTTGEGDIDELQHRHETGLLIAEAFMLGLGTLVWGFGDKLPY